MTVMRSLLGALCAALLLAPGLAAAGDGETLRYGRFGTVTLYHATPRPARVALFVSGDGGWNLGVIDMARELAGLDTLVVGIDIGRYLKNLGAAAEACSYPAADLEALSKFVQKSLGYPAYVPPVLVGYSSGATLVYAVLVQAPAGTFRGAISLGFCPDLEIRKPLCRGAGGLSGNVLPQGKGYWFLPAARLESPWIALQGTIDQVCDPASTAAYVKQVPGGEIVILPKVGHGFSVPRNWLPQFKEAFRRLTALAEPPRQPEAARETAARPNSIAGLPVVEVPETAARGGTLAVMLSGDGGWAGIDRDLAAALAAAGLPVAGLDSLQYFWSPKDPETAGADLERLLRHYLELWKCERAVLIGYSFGADVLPFMAARLPEDLRRRVALVALLGPGQRAEFTFRILDWVAAGAGKDALPLLPEIGRLAGVPLLCIAAEKETDSLCRSLGPGQGNVVTLKGGHHFGGDYRGIARLILAAVPGRVAPPDAVRGATSDTRR
jgi:type IV secretory pathway VirJ component